MNKISTEKAIEVLYTVRAYYASLTAGYPKGKDCKGIEDVTCSEIANSCLMAIEALNQEPKTGHWIPLGNYDDFGNESSYKCSECGNLDTYPDNFCPDCGAKMVESQERSE